MGRESSEIFKNGNISIVAYRPKLVLCKQCPVVCWISQAHCKRK